VKKVIIVRKYLATNDYKTVRLFDDSMSNLREFLKLRKEFKNIKFEAFFANPDGSVKVIK
jgi:glutaredoxin-related protein